MAALIGIVLAGIAVLAVVGIALALLGVVFGLLFAAVAAFFKILPVLVIGWAAVKLIQRAERGRGSLRRSDAVWLDTRR